jgi:hypothetical protein
VHGVGILGRKQRILAWIGFLALAAHAPIVAWLKPGDGWMASIAVAAIIAFVLVIDDHYRRRPVSPPDPSA